MSAQRRYFGIISVLVVVSALLRVFLGWNLGFVLLGFLVAWPIIGTLITLDDDFPGGWSNPDGTTRPEWATLVWWDDLLLCRGTFVVLGFAFEAKQDIRLAVELLVVAGIMGAVGFPILIRAFRSFEVSAQLTNGSSDRGVSSS